MKPRVAVTVCIDRGQRLRAGRDYWYVSRAYTQALAAAGALPLLVGPDADVAELVACCDGVVITGGDDLPASFGAAPSSALPGPAEDAERIAWERRLLDACAAQQRPTFGICYGMQLMNLHFGGTLHVNLKQCFPELDHGGAGRLSRHPLHWVAESQVAESQVAESQWCRDEDRPSHVNSSHQQAISQLAPGFRAVATASDGLIEAIENGEFFGVEWHPETDPAGAALFRSFVKRCRV